MDNQVHFTIVSISQHVYRDTCVVEKFQEYEEYKDTRIYVQDHAICHSNTTRQLTLNLKSHLIQ